jgi:hypothetical protein
MASLFNIFIIIILSFKLFIIALKKVLIIKVNINKL